jgi:hypothetical protein
MDDDALLKALRSKRADYDEELKWHRFLFDAYLGTGGFEGGIKKPSASFWGTGARTYQASKEAKQSYLDKHPREDGPKFERRVASSYYPSPVEPVVDIRLSYIHRKSNTREGIDAPAVKRFIEDATGNGISWDDLRRDVIDVRAEVLGWTPVLLDMPPAEAPDLTVQQANELGIRVRAIPLFPANLYDWEEKDGELVAVKVVTAWSERADLLSEAVSVRRYTIWTRTKVQVWETVGDEGQEALRPGRAWEQTNMWGFIPLVIFKHAPAPEDAVRGVSLVRNVALAAKKQFNVLSQLDEVLGTSAFQMLQVPIKGSAAPKGTSAMGGQVGVMTIGAGNALPVPMDSTRDYKWIGPDVGVAEILERRIEKLGNDITAIARMEYSGQDASRVQKAALSRAFEFENMNRALVDTAQQLANAEQDVFRKVHVMEGGQDEKTIRSTAPERFDVEEMAAELERVMKAITLPFGPTAKAELMKRAARTALPNIDPKVLVQIDSEIDEEQQADAEAAAALREMRTDPSLDPNDDPNDDPNADTPAAV